ncbi:MAG TPA: tol-pal system protein YbgF [Terriglobales bacterium]|nr:tol-pal system protein YbgF [Terriglobales bacterium]
MKRTLLAALLASGCVTTAQEGEQMRKDIASLRADMQKEAEANKAEREKLAAEQQKSSKQIQEALDQLSRASRKSGADLGVDLEKAQNDLAATHGQVEVLQHRLDALEKANRDQMKAMDVASQLVAQQKKEQERPTDKGALYNLARQKLDQGQTAKSRDLFQDFLTRFPKDELAANAQYWLGETYYAEKKWNDAIVEFQKVLKDYKGSEKIPDAVLKIGMSFQAQNDCQNALLFFDEVVQAHKNTPAAKTAHERAQECRKKKK